jgi:hypothetical protein
VFLNTVPWEKYAATLLAAPTPRPRLRLPSRRLDDPGQLEIQIGPTGVLVGAAIGDERSTNPPLQREDLVMWGLTDPQRATRIAMDTSEFYVRQLLVRAMAVGESIAIYSDQPARWLPLAQTNIAVVERRRAARLRADHRGRRPAHRAAIGGPVLDGDHPGPRRDPWAGARPALRADLAALGAGQLRRPDHGPGDRGVPARAGMDGMKLWLTRADLVARNLNGPASTTTDAHQLHLSRFCDNAVVTVRLSCRFSNSVDSQTVCHVLIWVVICMSFWT